MSSDLITSTMKSDPGRPCSGLTSTSTLASSAICCAVGRNTVGIFAAPIGGVPALATLADVAAPVTAAPARNFRRLTSDCGRFFDIVLPPVVWADDRHFLKLRKGKDTHRDLCPDGGR